MGILIDLWVFETLEENVEWNWSKVPRTFSFIRSPELQRQQQTSQHLMNLPFKSDEDLYLRLDLSPIFSPLCTDRSWREEIFHFLTRQLAGFLMMFTSLHPLDGTGKRIPQNFLAVSAYLPEIIGPETSQISSLEVFHQGFIYN